MLVVCCDSTVSDQVIGLAYDIQEQGGNKRMIILANDLNSKARFKQNEVMIKSEQEDFKFDDLSNETKEALLDKKINFQGQKLTVRDLKFDVSNIDVM